MDSEGLYDYGLTDEMRWTEGQYRELAAAESAGTLGSWRYTKLPRIFDAYRTEIDRLRCENDALTARLAAAEGVMRDVEWGGSDEYDYEVSEQCCPSCKGWRPDTQSKQHKQIQRTTAKHYGAHIGHKPDCRLAAFLNATPAPATDGGDSQTGDSQ